MQTDTTQKTAKPRRLSFVILEYLLICALISVFTFFFLYSTSVSIGESYLLRRGLSLNEIQDMTFHIWIKSVCTIVCILIFIVLFLFLLGQRLVYLLTIIQGIDSLRLGQDNRQIPLVGNDDLTVLAESINFLSASRRELDRREQAVQEERENWIRALLHDIRTPLTSLLSYTELMTEKTVVSPEEFKAYTGLVYQKADLINELTTRLMENREGSWEHIEDFHFLAEQLTQEWEEILESRFICKTNLSECEAISGYIDIFSLRRIMDNLASNIEKYADPDHPVALDVCTHEQTLVFIQTNKKKPLESVTASSHLIGLESVRRICSLYQGSVEISEETNKFCIRITLNIRPFL